MKKSDKMNYDAPVTSVVEMKAEGVICESSTLQDYKVNDLLVE